MIDNKRILYLMSIEWGWIKQRPHFIAEGLTSKYEVVTLSKKSIAQKRANGDTTVKVVYPIRLVPERVSFIKKINTFLYKLYLNYYIKRSKYIWFCSPIELSKYVLKRCTAEQVVIYDCMDDMLAFPSKLVPQDVIKKRESDLIQRADVIFCSANHLKNTIKERYKIEKEIVLLNNALSIDENSYASKDEAAIQCPEFFKSKAFKVTYIGTVAEWFDFELAYRILETIPDSEIHLFGPCAEALKKSHQHERMIFHGSVEHKYVKAVMKESNALFMPFVLTELIQSVNPVKLYEYIYSGVPCLAPYYGESVQFEDFCYLYNNREEAISYLSKIANGLLEGKQRLEYCIEFAQKNTWTERAIVIEDILGKM